MQGSVETKPVGTSSVGTKPREATFIESDLSVAKPVEPGLVDSSARRQSVQSNKWTVRHTSS